MVEMKLKALTIILVVYLLAGSLSAQQSCDALAPTPSQDVSESFKGEIEGELKGVIGKIAGGALDIDGEYSRIESDTLYKYGDSHRVYVWQRIIYLACVSPDIDIDLNKLLELYLIGPTSAEDGAALKGRMLRGLIVSADLPVPGDSYSNEWLEEKEFISIPEKVFFGSEILQGNFERYRRLRFDAFEESNGYVDESGVMVAVSKTYYCRNLIKPPVCESHFNRWRSSLTEMLGVGVVSDSNLNFPVSGGEGRQGSVPAQVSAVLFFGSPWRARLQFARSEADPRISAWVILLITRGI